MRLCTGIYLYVECILFCYCGVASPNQLLMYTLSWFFCVAVLLKLKSKHEWSADTHAAREAKTRMKPKTCVQTKC